MAANKYARATDHVKGIGKSLEGISGTDVLLMDYEYTTRQMRGEDHGFVALSISTNLDDPTPEDYHAWSDALGQKVSEIPKGALPVLIKFERVSTTSGFRVWTIS